MESLKGSSLGTDTGVLSDFIDKSNLNYLEIGCFDGVTLTTIALKYKNKKIYGIDPFISDGHTGTVIDTVLETQKQNLNSNISNADNIIFFESTTDQFLKEKPNYTKLNIDCVFVDGSHHYKDIMIDIGVAMECFSNNENKKGIIIFHDVELDDVGKAISEFKINCDNKNISYTDISVTHYGAFEVNFNQ